jgi:outer membrane protein assembly factor BamC
VTAAALALTLSACADLIPETKKIDYKSASRRVPTLEVPPDLTQLSRDDRFAVPDFSGKGGASFSEYTAERDPVALAQNSTVLPDIANLSIVRDSNQRWLVARIPSENLWNSVKDFWQEMGFIIATEAPEAGIMETDWAENRANIPQDFIRNTIGRLFDSLYSTGERDKFRTRFEPGEEQGTTDIFISHRRLEEVYSSANKSETRWQPAPSDPGLEAEMLRRLMLRLGSDERRAEAAIAAAPTEERATLANQEGANLLEVEERFDRVWRRVGLALDRVGFTVEDRDRSRGIYFVRYVDPEAETQKKDGGFLSRLTFWGKKQETPQAQYRVYLRAANDRTLIQIRSAEGGVDTSETAKKILKLLFEQLR